MDEASGSATGSSNDDSSDDEEEEDKVGLGKVALGMGEMCLSGMGGHMCGALLQRTCEVLVWPANCPDCQLSPLVPLLKRMLIVLGGVEEQEKVMSLCAETWSESDDEEYYMDSEEEQELMGCKLPEDQLRAALSALLHQRQGWQEEEGGATQQKPREKARQVSRRLCAAVSDPHLELTLVSAPELERKMPSQRKSSEEQEEDDLAGYADDESAHDQLPEKPTAADQKRCAKDEVGSEDSEGRGSEGSEGRGTGLVFRNRHGKLWSNSEVVTAIRIHVNQGHTIAPIYEAYLTVLRDKGFVESWSWAYSPEHTTLSLMVCPRPPHTTLSLMSSAPSSRCPPC